MDCANCESNLDEGTVSDSFELDVLEDGRNGSEIVAVNEAILLLFPHIRRVCCTPTNVIRLCPQCILVLAKLYKRFTQFKNLSTGSSYIHRLLSDPEAVPHIAQCIYKSAGPLKLENEQKDETTDYEAWTPPDIQTTTELEMDTEEPKAKKARLNSIRRKSTRKTDLKNMLSNQQPTPTAIPSTSSCPLGPRATSDIVLLEYTPSFQNLCCQQCPMKFTTAQELTDHDELYHNVELKPFQCNQCTPPAMRFETSQLLQLHEYSKHETKIVKHKCHHDDCSLTFSSERKLNLHLQEVHKERLKINCQLCPKYFTRKGSLDLHMKLAHNDNDCSFETEQQHTCLVCGKVFPTKSRLKLHLVRVHTTEEAVHCEYCKILFHSRLALRSHNKRYHGTDVQDSPSHACSLCGKLYRSKVALRMHTQYHLNKKEHVCEICGHCARSAWELRKHLPTHNPNRERPFPCPTCNRDYLTENQLKTHMTTHLPTEGKTQYCPYCPASMANAAALKGHISVRHQDIPEIAAMAEAHPCPKCGKEFRSKENLRQHLRSKFHHGKGTHPKRVKSGT